MGISNPQSDEQFMLAALAQAKAAAQADEVPVGAVVVHDNQIIARAHNQVITLNDPTAHAEVLALRQAAKAIGNYRLIDCELFVTLEPCSMCAGACVHARLKRLVYGASDTKTGVIESVESHLLKPFNNHIINATGGVLAAACGEIISDFFSQKRSEKKAASLTNKNQISH
ncbi:tRNA adenosine(34) deaminase TadA [Marinicella sp. S1101]|uniref:tRNA adenosine(34) deaminase TadA n=1 Tax=Marinicella marina TaxID=2996016 RepID=UPI002260DE57|nr:tRNA adenosine(34) deaminase TadA [Marinicella marina]MCX7553542.1 tRNA adenosine(34) deaminase TadA [Marinicella marina]MDJ1140166.1 tRNA adenosine(34) deaminase TadA [Marinicella marina]